MRPLELSFGMVAVTTRSTNMPARARLPQTTPSASAAVPNGQRFVVVSIRDALL
jgi:hypothetical protein